MIAAALLALTLAAFWPLGGNGFVGSDDNVYLLRNERVRAGLTAGGALWALTTTHGANWHPLTWLSHMLDASLFGLDPGPHHLVSLGIHAASTLVLFGVLFSLTGALWRSGLAAALFAVHPLHVEPVAWAAARGQVLSTLLWFLALGAYVRHVRRPAPARMAAVVAAAALALAAKPTPVTLPLTLLLLDFWPLGRAGHDGAAARRALPPLLREKAPLIVLSALSALATLLAQRAGGATVPLDQLPLPARAANALLAAVGYLRTTLWPSDLAVIYPHPFGAIPLLLAAAAGAFLLCATLLALRESRRRGYPATGWLWYLGTLVPVIGIVQMGSQAMADRYTYVPLVGIFIVLAWGAGDLAQRLPRARPAVAAALLAALVALALATRSQTRVWRDARTLFGHAAAAVPGNYLAESSLGVSLAAEGLVPEALAWFEKALATAPWYAPAHYNYGVELAKLERHEEAVQRFEQAIARAPTHAAARNNLGVSYLALGRTAEAERSFREALRVDPGLREAQANLAALPSPGGPLDAGDTPAALSLAALEAGRQGRWREAVERYERARSLAPASPQLLVNLGAALLEAGRTREAAERLEEGLRLDPGSAAGHNNLGNARAALGDREAALKHYAAAIRIAPEYAEAHNNLGVTLFELGRVDEAIGSFRRAVAISPGYAEARRNLDQALLHRGR